MYIAWKRLKGVLRKYIRVKGLATYTAYGSCSVYKCTCATLPKRFQCTTQQIWEMLLLQEQIRWLLLDLKAVLLFQRYHCFSLHHKHLQFNFKMCEITLFLGIFVTLCLLAVSQAVELTFELPDNANQCFHEDVEKDVKIILEYQVNIFFLKNWSL